MARIRYLKPTFFSDEDIGDLSIEARLFFMGLWCHADRAGRLEFKPRTLKVLIMPYDDIDASKLVDELHPKFAAKYNVGDKNYIQIVNFSKHQKPHKSERISEIPEMPKQETGKNRAKTEQAGFSTAGMGIGIGTGNGELERERELEKQPLAQPSKKVAQRENPQEFVEWWEAYPSKVGRLAALKVWKKQVQGKVELSKMLSILEKQKTSKKWTKDDSEFIPNPATYLNQGRWDDEVSGGGPVIGGADIIGSIPGMDLEKKYGGHK